MKKFILGLICGIGLTATTAVYAADTIQAYLFPAKFEFNGVTKQVDTKEYVVLNHNGHAYVPIRFVAESMGALVKYEDTAQTISIEQSNLSKNYRWIKIFFRLRQKAKSKELSLESVQIKMILFKNGESPKKQEVGKRNIIHGLIIIISSVIPMTVSVQFE